MSFSLKKETSLLREDRANTNIECITLNLRHFGEAWKGKDRSTREHELDLVKGLLSLLIPFKLLFLEHSVIGAIV